MYIWICSKVCLISERFHFVSKEALIYSIQSGINQCYFNAVYVSLFQNQPGCETSSWKNRQKPGFFSKSKEAVPKAEVLEQVQ
jgi:hypothetical protein